ncbi:phospholysine phosphohistidine inorganic pyrophosphate phosphatase [Strongylocentrotus purpuratus]|uniref:Phospholysine phosphohistidine inorganic pyrophosphate phosphatase n=1 Tax=Strongylocentrotus purpuratus TaxID=7668 RepID=A0A7M7HMU9_STRPU|nr:phospholysine phosphohistidine inorganic pyrophosphate phosphatase [Strongylocentrotus purpuratus]XP_030841317.1 phospholysine phosphohistidine inorganic pyrophosphate phosphatase [Strongylocentrotus purpuratus]|eukprot:XP_011674256.1 PREDICTED: phospholysine phosphohistidine inorganic pyrophosphate phosphatase-like isoform X1 [Strongylocentrotus purpuratus]
MASGNWYDSAIEGVLLDITGVLYNSTDEGGVPIPGSIEAVKRLKASGVRVRFCTNETQCTRQQLVDKLQRLGFELSVPEVFAPAPAACQLLKARGLTPHLLVYPGVLPEFEAFDLGAKPTCVVVGDAADIFNYETMNNTFRKLLEMDPPVLISMGVGKYYRHGGELMLDVGPFTKALEYAVRCEAIVVGKPDRNFFLGALQDMGVQPQNAIMVGDDIVNDVGGAQKCGLKGLQVRTGKFRPSDEHHPEVRPDGFVENLAHAVDLLLQHRKK